MNRICVFCASSDHISSLYRTACSDFGRLLAREGLNLIFGGGAVGLMGALAEAVKKHGGSVYGVIPSSLREGEGRYPRCDKLLLTETLAERKALMIAEADGFAVLPGGYGTLDEAFEILTLQRHGKLNCPVVFLNTGGVYDALVTLLQRLHRDGFLEHPHTRDFFIASDPEEAVAFLKSSLRTDPS
ncbi:MAG: TIGR00730 family Rossman fold protein [Spirochaetales bacterium]|nr:TIGR00730 family Rossman fold protein [Spirochaetales bacterium]